MFRKLRRSSSFSLCLFLLFSYGNCIEDKCEACRIVAKELTGRLDAEGPRNHVDMRHRLDKSGKRHGKVIEYKMSELRMSELLDDLCDTCNSYTWGYRIPSGGGSLEIGWIPNADSQNIAYEMSKEEAKLRRHELIAYCGRLIEEYEDDLVDAIRKGLEESSQVFDVLCIDLAKACSDSLNSPKEDL